MSEAPVRLFLDDVVRLAREELYVMGSQARSNESIQDPHSYTPNSSWESVNETDTGLHRSADIERVEDDVDAPSHTAEGRESEAGSRRSSMRLRIDDVWKMARGHGLGIKRRLT
ncbi:hypothetical protein KEM55_001922 [Ascosphaera atra]|nr:hypothetical protein KEM55_001922 [Ascosphaera atra]